MCTRTIVLAFLDKAHPLMLDGNILYFLDESGDKFIMDTNKGVKACSEWLSSKLQMPMFDVFQGDNLRKAGEGI